MTLKLLVLAEYGSSGIWEGERRALAEIEHEEIHLPTKLSYRFNDWIDLFAASNLPPDMTVGSSGSFDPVPLEEFDAIGRQLARDLKTFMGPDVVVRYSPRIKQNIGDPPELIE
jgi:hypothetical protein